MVIIIPKVDILMKSWWRVKFDLVKWARELVHIGLWIWSAKWEAREYLSGKRREILHVRRWFLSTYVISDIREFIYIPKFPVILIVAWKRNSLSSVKNPYRPWYFSMTEIMLCTPIPWPGRYDTGIPSLKTGAYFGDEQ